MLINHQFGFIGVQITRSGFNVLQRSWSLNIEEKREWLKNHFSKNFMVEIIS